MWPLALLLLGSGCAKEVSRQESALLGTRPGRLVVNELVATGSVEVNEFGEVSDWFEIHCPGPALFLKAGEWFVTDDLEEAPLKFELPEMVVPEGGFIVVWCDEAEEEGDDIHADFRLSDKDGSLSIVHKLNDRIELIDQVPIDATAGEAISIGRAPDGSALWTLLSPPTPGAPNEPLEQGRP